MRVPRRRDDFGEPLGPWTRHHSFGATVVVLLFLGIASNIWPGWGQLRAWIFA